MGLLHLTFLPNIVLRMSSACIERTSDAGHYRSRHGRSRSPHIYKKQRSQSPPRHFRDDGKQSLIDAKEREQQDKFFEMLVKHVNIYATKKAEFFIETKGLKFSDPTNSSFRNASLFFTRPVHYHNLISV